MYQAFLSLLPFYNLWIKTRIHQRQTNTGLKAFKEGKIRIDSVCMVVCSAIVNIVTVQPLFRTLSGESKNTVVQNSRRSRELIINDLRANPRERVCSGFEITEISTETKRKESKSQTFNIYCKACNSLLQGIDSRLQSSYRPVPYNQSIRVLYTGG